MESHDEERITYKNIKYGNSASGYNIRDTATALKRMELNAAFLLTIPGPKMIWEFGELGYDYSRCYLATNGEGGDCNTKTDPKPIRWNYQTEARRKNVFNVYSALNRLRFDQRYVGAFQSGTVDKSLGGAFKWLRVTTTNDTADVVVIGNFDVVPQTGSVTFPKSGVWYDYFGNFVHTATGAAQSFTLQPGEYHVYVNRNVNNLTATPVGTVPLNSEGLAAKVYPNPLGAGRGYAMEARLPYGSQATVDLYNSVGAYVRTVYSGWLNRGVSTVTLPALSLPSGPYFLKLRTKQQVQTISLTIQ